MAIIRTRVADDTWVFTSGLYLEVNAGLVVTPEGGILIDTLPFPSETEQIIEFADRICPKGIRYVINTVAHADHVYGSYLFPDAELIAHEHCRLLLEKYAFAALEEAKEHTPELRGVEIRLPKLVFNEGMLVRLGGKTVHVFNSPGPSPEVCSVHVREDKVLFSSDLMMPVPLIASPFSDIEVYKRSLANLHDYNLESIVQGHGDILLRGEVTSSIYASIAYLDGIQKMVDKLIAEGATRHDLLQLDIERFGRSRIPLGGMVQQFHASNLLHLWEKARQRQRLERQTLPRTCQLALTERTFNMMHTSNESRLLELVEAIRMLTPEQRHRLQRRLRASGLLSPEEYVTDRNRLRTAPAVAASAGGREVARAVSATVGMVGVFDADLPSNETPQVPPSGDDASEGDASFHDGAYRSSVSGRVVVGSPTDAQMEVSPEMSPLPGQAPEQPIEIIFDGGSRGNPGQGYGSYALRWPGLPQQVVRLRFGDKVTNNEAEYDTLITALEAVIKKLQDSDAASETAKLDVRGDSQLVVNQVLGHWECKEPHMQVRCDRVRYLLQRFGNWQLAHHDRKESVQTLGH